MLLGVFLPLANDRDGAPIDQDLAAVDHREFMQVGGVWYMRSPLRSVASHRRWANNGEAAGGRGHRLSPCSMSRFQPDADANSHATRSSRVRVALGSALPLRRARRIGEAQEFRLERQMHAP